MIISHPTGFYKFDIPNSLSSQVGNVTYTITGSVPSNIAAFFPKYNITNKGIPVVYDPFESVIVSKSLSVQPNTNPSRPKIGEYIESGYASPDFANWNNLSIPNISDLPEELSYLGPSILDRITDLSVERSGIFERLTQLTTDINDVNKVINAINLLKETSYYDTNIQSILDENIVKHSTISSNISELQARLIVIDSERLSLQKLIGGVSDAD